jgi:hypothetical protein
MTCYKKGDKVLYESPSSGDRTPALFVEHDMRGWPRSDAILAIKALHGPHTFRWPLAYIEPYDRDRVRVSKEKVRKDKAKKHKKRR